MDTQKPVLGQAFLDNGTNYTQDAPLIDPEAEARRKLRELLLGRQQVVPEVPSELTTLEEESVYSSRAGREIDTFSSSIRSHGTQAPRLSRCDFDEVVCEAPQHIQDRTTCSQSPFTASTMNETRPPNAFNDTEFASASSRPEAAQLNNRPGVKEETHRKCRDFSVPPPLPQSVGHIPEQENSSNQMNTNMSLTRGSFTRCKVPPLNLRRVVNMPLSVTPTCSDDIHAPLLTNSTRRGGLHSHSGEIQSQGSSVNENIGTEISGLPDSETGTTTCDRERRKNTEILTADEGERTKASLRSSLQRKTSAGGLAAVDALLGAAKRVSTPRCARKARCRPDDDTPKLHGGCFLQFGEPAQLLDEQSLPPRRASSVPRSRPSWPKSDKRPHLKHTTSTSESLERQSECSSQPTEQRKAQRQVLDTPHVATVPTQIGDQAQGGNADEVVCHGDNVCTRQGNRRTREKNRRRSGVHEPDVPVKLVQEVIHSQPVVNVEETPANKHIGQPTPVIHRIGPYSHLTTLYQGSQAPLQACLEFLSE